MMKIFTKTILLNTFAESSVSKSVNVPNKINQQLVLTQYFLCSTDIYDDYSTPVPAAQVLFLSCCKIRKGVLPEAIKFLNSVSSFFTKICYNESKLIETMINSFN